MVGSGLVPYAVYRDYFDVNGFQDQYGINFSGISKPVIWVNTALGYGANMAGSYLIPPTVPVSRAIVSGYGHLDILLSKTAQGDVWGKYNLDK